MNQTCIIIEDQPPAQRILQKYIKDIGSFELLGTFSDAIAAQSFIQEQRVDLMFLDIHLPKISGIDFVKTLQNPPKIILTTAFQEYALESYNYNVVDYLLKPFSFQRFLQAIQKANTFVAQPTSKISTDEIFIKSGYDIFKINRSDIWFIKSDNDYTEVVTQEKTYLSSESLKSWTQKLTSNFCQVHKSYLINITAISKISGNTIVINQHKLPIGRSYKEEFIKKLELF